MYKMSWFCLANDGLLSSAIGMRPFLSANLEVSIALVPSTKSQCQFKLNIGLLPVINSVENTSSWNWHILFSKKISTDKHDQWFLRRKWNHQRSKANVRLRTSDTVVTLLHVTDIKLFTMLYLKLETTWTCLPLKSAYRDGLVSTWVSVFTIMMFKDT